MAYQIKITLDGSKPPVWRRLLIDENITFKDFHFIIQAAMGWENSHLFSFSYPKDRSFSISIPADDWGMERVKDSKKVKVKTYLNEENPKMVYEYDFGDSWIHMILLEKILEDKIIAPACLKGKGACPPEDCGGIWGYYSLIEAINNPKSPEHEDMMEWLGMEEGEKWDENAFDLEECNKQLAQYKEFAKFDIES